MELNFEIEGRATLFYYVVAKEKGFQCFTLKALHGLCSVGGIADTRIFSP